MATEVVKIVDPDNGAGTDYLSLSAAITGELAIRADLVTRDEQLTLKCRSSGGSADGNLVTINGFTTDATRFVKIVAFDSDRAAGKWDSSKYRLSVNSTRCIIFQDDYICVEGLQIEGLATNTECLRMENAVAGASEYHISGCFVKAAGGSASVGLSFSLTSHPVLKIWNCILSNHRTGLSLVTLNAATELFFYNNTFYGDGAGTGFNYFFDTAGSCILKNNIAQNFSDGYNGTFDSGTDYNLSDISGDAPGSNSKNGVTVSFVDTASDDFHLAEGDTAARAAGIDLSADASLPFNDDIDGEIRWEWSMGADDVTQPAAALFIPRRFPASRKFSSFPSL